MPADSGTRSLRHVDHKQRPRRPFVARLGAMRFEYRVVQVRERMMGGALSADKLEDILNESAREGWQLRDITATEVKGRVGPGGVEGLLITFERPVG